MKFQDVIGQEQITGHLQNAIRMGKVSHAYILQGEAGSGKKLLAGIFAAALQCEEGGIEPCGHCQSCKQAVSGNHPDIRRITHEKAAIGVDDIRLQLNNDIMVKPYSRPYKVYIIDEAEKMTEQAQNAMLKTIEEPPGYAVILLLTVNAKLLLPTILSRCILLNVRPVARQAVTKLLTERHGIAGYMAEVAADFADGIPGRAIAYAQSGEFVSLKEDVLKVVKRLESMPAEEIYKKVKEWAVRKTELPDMLSLINLWFRDILVMKATKGEGRPVFREEEQELRRQAERMDFRWLEQCLEVIELTRQRMSANVNLEVSLEMMLYAMKEEEEKTWLR
ncbi:MAG: DNA polymerase III subunit delta' [Lachnospiraceae bacterium]|nr:DNA polymerase III subunit delta' [Lachnospiraceae bacterium]